MKMSLCQMIAIVCILAVGFLTVTPFVPEADADSYTLTVDIVQLTECDNCGAWSSAVVGTMTLTLSHADGMPHLTSGTVYLYGTTSGCYNCYEYA